MKDGRIKFVQERCQTDYLPDGTPKRSLGTVQDITERTLANEVQQKTLALLTNIINTTPDFIFVKDRDLRTILCNNAFAQSIGKTPGELIGHTDIENGWNSELVHGNPDKGIRGLEVDDREALRGAVVQIPAEPVSVGSEIRIFNTYKAPLLSKTGEIMGVLGIARDITERTRMEEVLLQREKALLTAVEEREQISQDLHDGILQSLFAVGLSLETCKSWMSLKNHKAADQIFDQVITQLNHVMHEIRGFIVGPGSDPLQGKNLATALQHMRYSLMQHHVIRIPLAVEDRAANALSAKQTLHLFRVIQEAVSNCIRHSRAQKVTVSLKMLKQGVRLSIRDNGCGFNPEAAKGTGHGLNNMAIRAQRLGGRLTIASKRNEGTRIVLDLPNNSIVAL